MGTMENPVKTLLEKCGTRQDILADAQRANPSLDLFAVHRWHQRDRVPSQYWVSIINGAQDRGRDVSFEDFARAHSPERAAS